MVNRMISVSSTLIILFTIYGAFLQFSGAGKFYIDFSFSAMGGKPTSAGRTVTLASFLLGGPSGSGVATTVTLGAVAAPMLAKVGYGKDEAGGLLAAGGLYAQMWQRQQARAEEEDTQDEETVLATI